MDFSNGHIYHVFNRSNNSQLVFPERKNYVFFLLKINEYILPHAQILAWCLMPTHFHLMIEVVTVTHPMTSSHRMSHSQRTLNDSIAILLRSYTRAINKQYKKHGSLFQQHSRAICLTEPVLSPSYFQSQFGTIGNTPLPELEYPNVCFNYIHFNPVSDGLVRNPEDWEFSSYRDYYCERKGKLINKELAKEIGLIGN